MSVDCEKVLRIAKCFNGYSFTVLCVDEFPSPSLLAFTVNGEVNSILGE